MAVRCASAAFACRLISTADLAMLAMPYVLCTAVQPSMGRSKYIYETAVGKLEWGCSAGRGGGGEASQSQVEGHSESVSMQGQEKIGAKVSQRRGGGGGRGGAKGQRESRQGRGRSKPNALSDVPVSYSKKGPVTNGAGGGGMRQAKDMLKMAPETVDSVRDPTKRTTSKGKQQGHADCQ